MPYPISDREREALAAADSINAILGQSSIKTGSEAAMLRARQQAAEQLQRQRNSGDMDAVAMAGALRNAGSGGGPFAGTSMEAQALNQLYQQSVGGGQMSHDDFMRNVAAQRLGRTTTVSTPQGTFLQQGYDVGALTGGGGGGGRGAPGFVPKPRTEGEKRGEYTTGNMRQLNAQGSNYIPSATEGAVEQFAPDFLKGYFQSNDYKAMRGVASEWAATLTFLRSGATATETEVTRAVQNFWPQPGDGPSDVQREARMREEAMTAAEKAYAESTGDGATPSGIDELLNKYAPR